MDRLTSMGLSNHATMFLRAAKTLRNTEKDSFTPTYFMACQSMELGLKAFLRGNGATAEHLKYKIGHDLCRAVNEAEKSSLSQFVQLSDHDKSAIEMIGFYYTSKDLQYAQTGFKEFPQIELILEITERLVTGTRDFCVKQRGFHEGKPSAVA